MSNENLRECPFCGFAARLEASDLSDIDFGTWYSVSCKNPNCGATLGTFEDKEQAISQWNTRIKKAVRNDG